MPVVSDTVCPVAAVLQLDGKHCLCKVSCPQVQFPDPLLDRQRTEDQVPGALSVESAVG